ncbi:MAG: transcriptional regulator [Candidatus Thiodiazotropha sp. (ex Lucinoma borealis)]|nr:transcriptional regulator [Candidatus Thiodiazotropha sp. (ex Lucinoma borealis)]
MTVTPIGDALFTKTQQKVLGLLFGKPDKSFYTNEIMRWAAMGRGTVSRELEHLVSADLLTVTKTGNQNHYQANANNPIFKELVSIVRKTFGIADVIREALMPLDDVIELAFIYGSMSKGGDTKSSDIDLMLVGKGLSYSGVMELLMPLEETLQRTINPALYEKKDFAAKLKAKNSFTTRVMEQPKIVVKGNDEEIRKAG